jgi:Ran GTPase-activating protein (RanGAP) involved in mRNA processing and transport
MRRCPRLYFVSKRLIFPLLDVYASSLLHRYPLSDNNLFHCQFVWNNSAQNNLVGTLPHELEELRRLKTLNVYKNSLHGVIPESYQYFVNMELLDVEENTLTGNPFKTLQKLPKLRQIHLSQNMFTGTLQTTIGKDFANVYELWMGNNAFNGTIPAEIGQIVKLGMICLVLHRVLIESMLVCVTYKIFSTVLNFARISVPQ